MKRIVLINLFYNKITGHISAYVASKCRFPCQFLRALLKARPYNLRGFFTGEVPILAGITSWGTEQCAVTGFPGIYTNIFDSEIYEWFLRMTRFLINCRRQSNMNCNNADRYSEYYARHFKGT